MIINKNSEFKIMQILTRFWFREFSAYELSRESKISVPMVYRAIEKFLSKKIISQNRKKIKINFNNFFAYNFKLLYDAERFSELSQEYQEKVNNIFNAVKSEYLSDLLGFIIFGSVASEETTETSDLDILVIVKEKKEINYRKKGLLKIEKINIIEKNKNELENEYLLAHDLVLNALMNGIVIFDEGVIRFLLTKPLPQPSNEVIMQKKERLDILKDRLLILLKDKNYKELVEQFKLYIIEKARILFLQKDIIPSSKKYIINNLKEVDKNLYNLYHHVNNSNAGELLKNV
ncbi:MAG: nucleotidyltransferase domain-containing protein [Candidatus Pacearchaeota archaeon]|nr:nucleotidyltransferase domain-containing protein [Candidatus Pacearchaeota archaeon]